MSKNCLECTYFLRQVIYRYNGRGSVIGIQQTMKCTKFDMIIEQKNCQEKNNKIIPNYNCEGRYFVEELYKPNIELPKANFEKIVYRDN
jgi:hypothetical protein